MDLSLQLFVIPASRVPGGPPEPAKALVVQAASRDGLREAAKDLVAEQGLVLRSISFGPEGLVVYAQERA